MSGYFVSLLSKLAQCFTVKYAQIWQPNYYFSTLGNGSHNLWEISKTAILPKFNLGVVIGCWVGVGSTGSCGCELIGHNLIGSGSCVRHVATISSKYCFLLMILFTNDKMASSAKFAYTPGKLIYVNCNGGKKWNRDYLDTHHTWYHHIQLQLV